MSLRLAHLAPRVAAVAALVAGAASATACVGGLGGCDPATNGDRAAIVFTPSLVEATRTPATCSVTEPAFSSKDRFTLEVTGVTSIAPPHSTLTLLLTAAAPSGEALPLTVDAQGSAASTWTAGSADGSVNFSLTVGSDPTELDATGVSSVVVTVDAMPTADGQPLSAEVQVYFVDGRELDQTYSASLRTAVVLCPKVPAGGTETSG
jgi:hypothetical protein